VNNATVTNPRRIAAALAVVLLDLIAGCTGAGSGVTGAGSPTAAATAGSTTAFLATPPTPAGPSPVPLVVPGQPGLVGMTVPPAIAFIPRGTAIQCLVDPPAAVSQFRLMECNSSRYHVSNFAYHKQRF